MTSALWTLYEPDDPAKKWAVRVPSGSGSGSVEVKFGARGYEDFTIHKDVDRRERYRTRHQHDHIDDPYAPGFWSWWALWGESDNLDRAFADAVKRAKKILGDTMPRKTRHNPMREVVPFDFTHYEEYAASLSNNQLHHAIEDARRALEVARTWDDGGAGEAKYSDQLGVLQQERRRRVDRQYFEERGVPRTNPEWAKSLGRGLYKGARYAGEAARDLYHGAKEAHSARSRENPEHPGFDEFGFRVSTSFLPALFYGDTSGLSPEDEEALEHFCERVYQLGENGHWAVVDEDAGFGRDEITGLGSDRALIAYMVPRE